MTQTVKPLSAPFPWFGGKSTVADKVWAGLGDVSHYVEPFFGSGAVLLRRPHAPQLETVNDLDCLVSNFWRAVRADPDAVADYADWPCNEADLHARHIWLIGERESLTNRLMGDADWFDAKAAGWWVWGACNWIGSGWCSGNGPWVAVDGMLTDSRQLPHLGDAGMGIKRNLPHLSDAGMGINRKLPHLGNAGRGIKRQLPHLGDAGRGINRQRPHLGPGIGINRNLPHLSAGRGEFIRSWMLDLAERLRPTRVACGDWSRVTGPSVLRAGGGIVGVFLDPPYALNERAEVYAMESPVASSEVSGWCAANGNDPALRIVLAGYDGEHNELEGLGWTVEKWKAHGGYGLKGDGRGRDNASRERLWFSPHCVSSARDLFSMDATL